MLLHEWLYDLCSRVCHDREYLYLFFLTHFQAIMSEIVQQGRMVATGTYIMPGRKSHLKIVLHWSLSRRVDWTAPNALTIRWQLQDRRTGAACEQGAKHFVLATGDPVPGPADGR